MDLALQGVRQLLDEVPGVVERSSCLLGCWIRWHADGQPAVRAPYVNGLLEGKLLAWYPVGIPALRMTFREGVLDGPVPTGACESTFAAK